jgi:hypothetical protein
MTVMDEHVFDDLPQLLTGEADRSTVVGVGSHLRSCADCTDELVSAVVAHASLMSAVRFAPELAVSPEVLATVEGRHSSSTPVLPDMSAMFAQVRGETGSSRALSGTVAKLGVKRMPVRYRILAAAAVVSLALAGGGVYLSEGNTSTSSPTARSVALSAFDKGTTSGKAVLTGANGVQLDASSLPAPGTGSYYEVWLTNSTRTSLAPVGQLDTDGKGTFVIPANMLSTYGAIEVSVQTKTGDGSYSGTSVLRGSYA